MKINAYARVAGLLLSISVAAASASEKLNVEASMDLKVAVIDMSGKQREHAQLHEALGTCLSAGMTRECKSPVRVAIDVAEAPWAARQLRDGSCDAVVVIGNSVPTALLRDGVVVWKAIDAGAGDPSRTFFLLTHPRDPGLNQVVGLAFDHALKAPTFQDALAGKGSTASIAASSP